MKMIHPRAGAAFLFVFAATGAWGQLALGKDEQFLKENIKNCKEAGGCEDGLLKKISKLDGGRKKRLETNDLKEPPKTADEEPRPSGDDQAEGQAEGQAANAPDESPSGAGGPSGAAKPPTAAQADASKRDLDERGRRAMTRASNAADSLRRSMRPADAGGPGPGAAGRTNESGLAPAGPLGPRTIPEMALAARAGYAETFSAHGLKVGVGLRGEPAIQREDGSPASEPELARLGKALRAEPAALALRPDFFEVLPRPRFAELKKDFEAREGAWSSVFKDIGMTAGGRDFQWSASCSSLSGTCNPAARGISYVRGHNVPPETLGGVWKSVRDALEAAEEEEEIGAYTEEDHRLAAAEDLAVQRYGAGRRFPSLGSLLARMGKLAQGLGESAGLGSAGGSASAVRSSFGREGLTTGAAGFGEASSAVAARRRAPRLEPPSPERPPAAARRSWTFALAAAAALLLILLLFKKKR